MVVFSNKWCKFIIYLQNNIDNFVIEISDRLFFYFRLQSLKFLFGSWKKEKLYFCFISIKHFQDTLLLLFNDKENQLLELPNVMVEETVRTVEWEGRVLPYERFFYCRNKEKKFLIVILNPLKETLKTYICGYIPHEKEMGLYVYKPHMGKIKKVYMKDTFTLLERWKMRNRRIPPLEVDTFSIPLDSNCYYLFIETPDKKFLLLKEFSYYNKFVFSLYENFLDFIIKEGHYYKLGGLDGKGTGIFLLKWMKKALEKGENITFLCINQGTEWWNFFNLCAVELSAPFFKNDEIIEINVYAFKSHFTFYYVTKYRLDITLPKLFKKEKAMNVRLLSKGIKEELQRDFIIRFIHKKSDTLIYSKFKVLIDASKLKNRYFISPVFLEQKVFPKWYEFWKKPYYKRPGRFVWYGYIYTKIFIQK